MLHLAHLEHRGEQVHQSLLQREGYRRRRRTTNLRYRAPASSTVDEHPGGCHPRCRAAWTTWCTGASAISGSLLFGVSRWRMLSSTHSCSRTTPLVAASTNVGRWQAWASAEPTPWRSGNAPRLLRAAMDHLKDHTTPRSRAVLGRHQPGASLSCLQRGQRRSGRRSSSAIPRSPHRAGFR